MKRLSFRFVRRLMLLLALVFPVVYLMGGFVAALAGSHGNVTLAQDDEVVTSTKFVDFNQLVQGGDFSDLSYWRSNYVSLSPSEENTYMISSSVAGNNYATNTSVSFYAGHKYFIFGGCCNVDSLAAIFEVYYNNTQTSFRNSNATSLMSYYYDVLAPVEDSTVLIRYTIDGPSVGSSILCSPCFCVDLTQMFGVGNEPTADVFRVQFDDVYYPYTVSSSYAWETYGAPTYSEYLFNQILGSDNIIKQWGYYALSDEDKGFAPFASLIQIVDDNFFHLGDSNDLGLFVYGYVYYALNIVAIYELVALVVMVFTIPLKLTDRFTKEM